MTDRKGGWVKQGYWFGHNNAVMIGVQVNESPRNEAGSDLGFAQTTRFASAVRVVSGYGTVVYTSLFDTGAIGNDRINILLENHTLEQEANGTLSAAARSELQAAIVAVIGGTVTIDAQSGGWYASESGNGAWGTGVIANIT